ncbi:hypothetical protein JCGZ_09382 [Jatropha curcas]|uniref:S-protein homolog n=1 Tax=Jatropha curcas TaxID=180498 RepID=A0A067KJT7_JATCU|nr:hypothetical protein JCGZ_09382 [Jatropha curcas]
MSHSGVTARPKYHVYIVNGLNGNNLLEIHCQSDGDDLGHHVLPVSGNFGWSFSRNIFGTTVFWCEMKWAHGHGIFKVFWNDEELRRSCNMNCIWLATTYGLYLKDARLNQFQFMYQWLN